METWKYKAFDSNKKIVTGTMETKLGPGWVCDYLTFQGYEVLSVSKVRELPLFNILTNNKKGKIINAKY